MTKAEATEWVARNGRDPWQVCGGRSMWFLATAINPASTGSAHLPRALFIVVDPSLGESRRSITYRSRRAAINALISAVMASSPPDIRE